MSFIPQNDEQRRLVETEAAKTVVLGGAGVGKTTSALAAARAHLERSTTASFDRVLFLSFSRASVGRISSRSHELLGSFAPRVDVMTFHSLAFSLVRRFGSVVGCVNPVLVSPPREKHGVQPGQLVYSDLMPLALKIIRASPAVANHVSSRWGLVIVDEFQDTGNAQQELLEALAKSARVMLLGDPDQCIFTFLARDGVRLERIHEACEDAGALNTVLMPDASFRDPSGVIPAVARAIQRREFSAPALREAISTDRLQLLGGIAMEDEVEVAARVVKNLREEGLGVAIFTHHNDKLAVLSDGLAAAGVDHEILGLSDAIACALDAQVALLRFGAGIGDWGVFLESLAVFVTSAQRGKGLPLLAREILEDRVPPVIQSQLNSLKAGLVSETSVPRFLELARNAHSHLGLMEKESAWALAAQMLRPMHARARRETSGLEVQRVVEYIGAAAREATYSLLTDTSSDPHEVQLMNLYQTKGREADATVVILRQGDVMGYEDEPFPSVSRLLYVVFSRARQRIVVLLVGENLHPAVSPLADLAADHSQPLPALAG